MTDIPHKSPAAIHGGGVMNKNLTSLKEALSYAKERGDSLIYVTRETASNIMSQMTVDAGRISVLEKMRDEERDGFKGGCYACEAVGELNIKLETRVKELEARNAVLENAIKDQSSYIASLEATCDSLSMDNYELTEPPKGAE